MPDVRAMWRNRAFEAVFGAAYNFGIEHDWLAKPFGRAIFGTDAGLIYDAMAAVGAMPDGSAILDVPCGGGVAMRALRATQRVRYVAADISPTQLDRARRRAAERGLDTVELVEADVERMPFPDGEFDLCLCFNGLHCLPDPAAAVREMARCLRPGGRLVGDVAVRGERRRADAWIAAARSAGIFGPSGTLTDVRAWLTAAGLEIRSLSTSGAVVHFTAAAPSE
ncbi:MAG TPA: class I SAM-dependent methyltransferase [Actinophytocola sp.]|uniref:class I SAM-dependent methyltransferase n=1 Tax=Actinophytocola sp. TaxID=1872138 RepID=UPI002DDCD27D|nr:class I SAM-dependent methyltransferase [Actinophytocola sp.]HEV2777773.1 class I SAM-dependent methyltransferase [Actinophytocola sp.]